MLERNCMVKLKINLQNPVWLSLGALFCCVLWGSAFPCVKIAYPLFRISDTGSQILFAGVRFFISGIITFIVGCILEKRILRVRKLSIPGIIRQGLLQTTIQYTCFHISLAYISSSESAIINASNVFISVIAAHFLLKNERLSWETIFGCIAGLAGVILINLTGILNGSFSFRGEGLMLAAAASYGISNVYLKKIVKQESPMAITSYQILFGSLLMIIIGICMGGRVQVYSLKAACLLLYLAALSAAAFSIWTLLLKYNPVGKVTMFAFSIPVFGVIMSGIFLGESVFSVKNIIALVLVSVGIGVVNAKHGEQHYL